MPSLSLLKPAPAWLVGGVFLCLSLLPAHLATLSPTPPKLTLFADHQPQSPKSNQPVTLSLLASNLTVQSALAEYQVVDPGAYIRLADAAFKSRWTPLPMSGTRAETTQRFTAEVPAATQTHRRLIRYRFKLTHVDGRITTYPPVEDPEPNRAFFVYDQTPAWTAAIAPQDGNATPRIFPASALNQVQTYHLIAKQRDVENATWYQQNSSKEYLHTGTLVVDGIVYDHVRFRARGGVWRHAMGKNMWKIDFNKGHRLRASDDYGRPYKVPWGKLNLRACIQQGDYGRRGEAGLYEAVGFRLFNLVGVPAPRTHWISLRIVGEKDENPPDQYRGDFWGLYLAIENEDSNFIKEHDLPDGNLYKMMFGQGELANLGANQPTNNTDLNLFLNNLRQRTSSTDWVRKNIDLPSYYSYRSIVEAIHHYDISDGKNYDFFRNPHTGQWITIPWDIDLTWGDHMYGGGHDPLLPVLSKPQLRIDYANRLREIRDLLYNPEEIGRLINECASIIHYTNGQPSIVDADRYKWDYHPIMSSRYAMQGKADKGRFYGSSKTKNFEGMVQQMKHYVVRRSAYIDNSLLQDPTIPKTPTAVRVPDNTTPNSAPQFKTSAFEGPQPFLAMQWRIGQTAPPISQRSRLVQPGIYEITPVWQSAELTQFNDTITPPTSGLKPKHTYRLRVRMKDQTGRWSHWSAPVPFTLAPATSQ